MTLTNASATDEGFEIEHRTLGSIVLDRIPTRREPGRGWVQRTGQPIVAVLTQRPPSPEVLDRLATVDHPDLVEWFGTCEVGNSAVAISALAEGGTLSDRHNRRRLDEAEVARLVLSIAAALDALAANGLSHGDLSPANIVLDAGGRPLLADLHDCTVADGTPLARATPGFEGISGTATASNDLGALSRLVEYLAHGVTTWSTKGLRDAVELLSRGHALSDTVTAELRDRAAPRIEILEQCDNSGPHIEMITRPFGPRPDRSTPPSSDPNPRRVLIGAAVLCAAVTAAVLWGEQPPLCDDHNCAAEPDR